MAAQVVVTGATGAVGAATAEVFAARGLRVVLVSRSADGLAELAGRIDAARTDRDTDRVRVVPVDLSDPGAVRAGAAAIAEGGPVGVLVNCAAIFTGARQTTVEGRELMFATNQLGPFLLTNLLRDELAAAHGRVVTVTAPSTTRIDFDDLDAEKSFSALRAFGASKAANLLFTYELARRAAPFDVTANAVHPGLIRSDLMRQAAAPVRLLTRLMSRSPRRAASAIAALGTSGRFLHATGGFYKGTKLASSSRASRSVDDQHRLWERCAELTGLRPDEGFPPTAAAPG